MNYPVNPDTTLDLASLGARPHPDDVEPERCWDCGDPFTTDTEWDDRHDIDGIAYHPQCCPDCNGGECDGCHEVLDNGCVSPDDLGRRFCSDTCEAIAADIDAADRAFRVFTS